jgi:hypothetical protein
MNLKRIAVAVAVIGTATLLQGCAVTDQLTSTERGTYISTETMRAFVDNKATEYEVNAALGQPDSQQVLGKQLEWSYGYTKISWFSQKNLSEAAVFEFDERGVLLAHYKTSGDTPYPTADVAAEVARRRDPNAEIKVRPLQP